MSRVQIKTSTIKRLFAFSGNQCAFPNCNELLVDTDGDLVSEICHIEAAEEGGQRYNKLQNDEERRDFDNLLLLCLRHHKKTNDVLKYPVPVLKQMKADHEQKFAGPPYVVPHDIEDKIMGEIVSRLEKLYALSEKTYNLLQDNTKRLTDIHDLLQSVTSGSLIFPTDDSKIYSEQLDFIKKFRELKQPKTGLNALLQFKAQNWDKINPELKYKVLANLGGLLFELGRQAEGAQYLVQLKDVDFESADRLSRLCLGYAILGKRDEFEEIFSQAIKLTPEDINLWVAYIHIQPDDASPERLEDALPMSLLQKPEIVFALGEALIDRGKEDQGFEMMERSLALSEPGLEASWQLMGVIESKKLLRIATLEKIALRQFSSEELERIKSSGETLNRIWEYVSGTEYISGAWYIIMNIGITHKILGNDAQAEADLRQAWLISKSFRTYQNLLFQYLDTGKVQEADILANEAKKEGFKSADLMDIVRCQVRLRVAQNNVEDAVKYVEEKLKDTQGADRLLLLDLIALIYFQAGTFEKVGPIAEQMITEFPDAPEGYLAAGIAQRRIKEPEHAIANLERAQERIAAAQNCELIWLQMGIAYSEMKLPAKAARCLEHTTPEGSFDERHIRLARACYEAREYEKAIQLCESGRAVNPADIAATEVLYRAYYETGRAQDAEAVLESYLSIGKPETFDHFRFLSAMFHQERGDQALAAQQLLQLEHVNKLNRAQRFVVAHILTHSGHLSEGLEVGYDARADYFDNVKAHEDYFRLLYMSPASSQAFPFPEEVATDCAVILRDESGTENKFLLSDDKRLSGSEILRQKDKITQSLLGKKSGDTISIASKIGLGNKLTIVSIESKFVYAVRESEQLLATRFSGETDFKIFTPGDDNDFNEVRSFMLSQSAEDFQRIKELFRLYEGNMLTIGALAYYLRRDFIETWFRLIGAEETCIKCYTHDESNDIAGAFELGRKIVIEPIALLTSQVLLQKHSLLENFGLQFVVAQSTLAELKKYRQELDLPRPVATVGIQDGELRKHDWTEEQHENHKLMADSLIQWCERNATIMSPAQPLKRTDSDEYDLVSFMGQAFHDSILLANELNGTLLSDDERLKALALGEYGLPSFSCYQLAVYKHGQGQISGEDFSAISKTLAGANYAYLPLSADDLWNLFDESGFQMRAPFTRAVRGLRAMSIPFCAQTIALFARRLYLNIAIDSTRHHTLLLLLSEAKANPAFQAVRAMLVAMIKREFRIMPIQCEEVLSLIQTLPASKSR